jgi:hypothetical protein
MCGIVIERGRRAGGPLPTYCSAECKNQARRERERVNGVTERRKTLTQEKRALERALRPAKPCPYCGVHMSNPRRKQCGQPECKRHFHADRMRDYMRERRTTDPEFAARHRAYNRKAQRRVIVCENCGGRAEVTKRSARYCSHGCALDAGFGDDRPRDSYAGGSSDQVLARLRGETRRRKAERWLARAAAGTRGSGVLCAGRCVRCGDSFVRRCTTPTGHCSRRCWARDKNAARRALLRALDDGTVSRWRIFERDGWTCHICGDPVDRNAEVPDLAAPTLDHVVPLARGGRHTETNIKTAHFYCNSVKRDLEDGWSVVAA